MIRLNISLLMFFYILFSAVVILIIWVIACYKKTGTRFDGSGTDCIWKCAVCANVYIDSRHEDMSACPLCGSYNKREVSG